MVEILLALLTVIGLCLFEMVSSIDNVIINADMLARMSKWARRWFLIWGILIAVFLIRGGLPFLIIYSMNPQLGLIGAFLGSFSGDPNVILAIESSAPPLLMGGGLFLIFLFLHWLFLEPKSYGLVGEQYIQKKGNWFYGVALIILTGTILLSIQANPLMAFGAAIGSMVFFITHGFRRHAEARERQIKGNEKMSDWSKILYLEVIDASFSIDGVLGAFAFTLSVPLILVGNGLGALLIRRFTVTNIEVLNRYRFLKNGAMYSIGVLGCVMVGDAFALDFPEWVSPLATILILGYFFYKSNRLSSKAKTNFRHS